MIKIYEKLVLKLIEKNITVSAAESCTGGLLSSAFVDIPGSSDIFLEGVVTYSNEAKVMLGVNADTLKEYGAVSEQVALQMATAVKLRAGADIGLSTTGIAGPGGGSAEKPVGLVYAAIVGNGFEKVYKLNFDGNRTSVRQQTVEFVTDKLYEIINLPKEGVPNGK